MPPNRGGRIAPRVPTFKPVSGYRGTTQGPTKPVPDTRSVTEQRAASGQAWNQAMAALAPNIVPGPYQGALGGPAYMASQVQGSTVGVRRGFNVAGGYSAPASLGASRPQGIGRYGPPVTTASWAELWAARREGDYAMGPPDEPMGGRRAPERRAIEEKRRKQALYAQQYPAAGAGEGWGDFSYGGGWGGGGGGGGYGGGGSNPLAGALMMWRIGYE